ncbi:hypothetical protein [Alishewanella tabrizica]|uniref:Uncharacterized protein n=1 Tax=Alishewanella tabrizica TaxID=671278 RepID=A0ABQ2WU90_9ALTE|nr:hypothetical protein [Alishewanella tabrizica]GGW68513.1 hypothetical protein GCM10008111_25600 [Alishewanella tabrizica]
MRVLNLIIAFLYLSLLVTTDLGTSHDQRLSPLADSQFQAVQSQATGSSHGTSTAADHEPDEPDATLSFHPKTKINLNDLIIPIYSSPWLSFSSSPNSARAPPAI